jgi:hypothetical protein
MRPFAPVYGIADVGSAIEDIENVIEKIKTNKFSKDDLIKLYNANGELIKAILSNEYEN